MENNSGDFAFLNYPKPFQRVNNNFLLGEGMSAPLGEEALLSRGREQEKKYDWLGAAESYEKALDLVAEQNSIKKGEVYELLRSAFYHAAMQAKDREEFVNNMHKSIASCKKASEFYGATDASEKTPRTLLCDAMIAYTNHWLASDMSEKKRLLDVCWSAENEALKAYDKAENQIEFGKTCIELAICLDDRLDLEVDTGIREKILDEAVSHGEKAIGIFTKARFEHELARAYCITSIHCFNAAESLALETKRKECERKVFEYAKEAMRISEAIGDKLILARSIPSLGNAEVDLRAGVEAASELFQKALQCCVETGDHRVMSEVFDGLAYSTAWSMIYEEDLERMREKSWKCEEYASKAINWGILSDYGHGIPHSYAFGYVHNLDLLASREMKLETRRELLKKAVTLGKQGLEYAQRTGSSHAFFHISTDTARVLYHLSTIEVEEAEKRQLLVEAMELGEKAVFYTSQLRPHFMLPQALAYEALALTLLELSKLEKARDKKKELLEKSVSRMETCVTLTQKHVTSFPSRRELFAMWGNFETELGSILSQFYQATGEKEILRKVVETCQAAVEMNSKADLANRVAEAYWQMAVAHDILGECLESAIDFESASKQYELSAHNIPQLSSFYMDFATYMQAWSDIEKARHYHARQEYGLSNEYYEKASAMHKSLTHWSYLAPNYSAWAQIEKAEDLSRREQSEDALRAFEEAVRLFTETKKSLQAETNKIENLDEKQMATSLTEATDIRRKYCLGRIALEEARILDKKGDHYSSSEKYGLAAETFERVHEAVESEQDKNELKLMATLSRAWQKMTQAEAETSPALYMDAARLFDEAKELSSNEKTKTLALGHSHFCRALEAGTKFADTGDTTLHRVAQQHLESAAKYYVKAGFQSASEYAKATELLFDAYVNMDNAKKETNPERKAKLYAITEKVLQTSAGSYMKAEHPEKSEQVLRLLEKVKEERELALSISEVLHAPTIVSATTAFSGPTPTHENAVGLERFEHADIQANVITSQKELKVGESLDLEIELVNAGKSPALLTKITEVIPEGFELSEKLEVYRVEDSYINMKGKRLDPLKTEEVRLILKPKVQGEFPIKPRILYLDENGGYKSHQPEPVTITVKEPELKGLPREERVRELRPVRPQTSEFLSDRIATGYEELDNLLFGGIPKNYAVILTSPPCDERDLLIKRFLETGLKNGEVTFYVTINPSEVQILAEEFPNFHLFICNPQADKIIKDLPNTFKLKGVENLTDISIALTSALRKLNTSGEVPRRGCIEIISDVLLQHHAVQTRKWLTGLITELKAKSFTTLAIIDPGMHPPEEVRATLDLFEGEISLYEKETEAGLEKLLRIKKLHNREYSKAEAPLRKEKLQE
jgi:KaiC/GvpD/RAD55 family RecA-like ATPase